MQFYRLAWNLRYVFSALVMFCFAMSHTKGLILEIEFFRHISFSACFCNLYDSPTHVRTATLTSPVCCFSCLCFRTQLPATRGNMKISHRPKRKQVNSQNEASTAASIVNDPLSCLTDLHQQHLATGISLSKFSQAAST